MSHTPYPIHAPYPISHIEYTPTLTREFNTTHAVSQFQTQSHSNQTENNMQHWRIQERRLDAIENQLKWIIFNTLADSQLKKQLIYASRKLLQIKRQCHSHGLAMKKVLDLCTTHVSSKRFMMAKNRSY
ncbi:uncharacterized protein LOC105840771 isoform X2 [Monomorium pharaonis]|uniref:uncharacterized protein LOC105840771 isoform X2 n=1 Tax=Monomorium pharaonis TaxID=307658 RepID=UPI001747B3F3|nr:uncharacterized protein LOC105840771 isoform X2 [Monomorium pharaonis]XP_036146662.1 uncharacterized protein LOC105840771 isoform X2 [Monomorium pharaonis]